MIDDYTTTFSHYITYTFLFKGWENDIFELGSERVNVAARCLHMLGVCLWAYMEKAQYKCSTLIFTSFAEGEWASPHAGDFFLEVWRSYTVYFL